MTTFDAIIIYLAIGAAFAAHRLFRDQNVTISYRIVSAFSYFVFWLPLSIRDATARLISREHRLPPVKVAESADDPVTGRIADIGSEIEGIVSKSVALPVTEFRETFDRYVGLHTLPAEDALQPPEIPASDTVFGLSGHPNPELAVKCVNRRNRSRIRYHQRSAANDLLRMLTAITHDAQTGGRIAELSHELAVILNDTEMAEELKIYFSGNGAITEWNTEPAIRRTEPMSSNLRI